MIASMSPEVTVLVYVLATVIAAAVVTLTRFFLRQARSQSSIHEAVLGRPAGQGVPAVPSMLDKFDGIGIHLAQQDLAMTRLEHEVMVNNGSSIKDTVNVIAGKLTDVSDKLNTHIVQVEKTRKQVEKLRKKRAQKLV